MELERKAMRKLDEWKDRRARPALLVSGARQVGKTHLVREFGRSRYGHFVDINLIDVEGAADAFNAARSSDDLFSRITLYADAPLVPGDTLVFIDEVQEAPDVITAAKFLVEKRPEFDFAFSGSLLGIGLKGVRSWPVGFMSELRMFPLDFEEFCWARGLAPAVLEEARGSAGEGRPLDPFVHERLLGLFYYYLAVGGMPRPVATFADTGDLARVRADQDDIIAFYRHDITKYCDDNPLFVQAIYDGIPAQLNQQNKRYIVSSLGKSERASKRENQFLWLSEAGVALPAYNVDEPRHPLAMAVNSTLFKLFMSDVGLLSCASGTEVVRKTLMRAPVNYGAVYENFVAQELAAAGQALYYFRSKRLGEVDFVVDHPDGRVLPVEVKSGKDYHRFRGINNVLDVQNYGLREGVVLCDGNVEVDGRITYLPIYLASLL